ncbi:MAG TPA: 2Fe-2S iron-sulfur cluster-binding protein, partial [Streptosporangiaceae bacterium]
MTIAGDPAQDSTFVVNGATASVPGSMLLLSAVRDQLGLTGAKPGCLEGACGACTVLLDGEAVRACQRTADSVAGRQVTTIEGLSEPGGAGPARLHPVQQAFAEEGAGQCGYCTSGMILTVTALLASNPRPDDAAIDAALATQICRCGTYPRIRRAVHRAAALLAGPPAGVAPGPSAGSGSAGGAQPDSAPDDGQPGPDAPPGPDGDRWAPPLPGEATPRPARPWDLTDPADRDWFGILGDGLVVTLDTPPAPGVWTTASTAWLHVSPAGLVTAFTGKVDVGQDNRTAFRQLVAQEMGVPLAQVRMAMGDTDLCPYDMGTFGSRSLPDAGQVLRKVAAHARTVLPARPGERRIEPVTTEPELSAPSQWSVAGQPHLPPGRLAAVTGARRFVSDLTQSGLWHGAVLRPPVPGATLRSLDAAAVAGRP